VIQSNYSRLMCSIFILLAIFFGFLMSQLSGLQWFSTTAKSASSSKAPLKPLGQKIDQWNIKVTTQSVRSQAYDQRFRTIGLSKAKLAIDLYPQVTEEVVSVFFQGQEHKLKGDLLVQLNDQDEKLLLESATIRLSEAKRLLQQYSQALSRNAVPGTDVASARVEVQQAEIAVQQAKNAIEDRAIRAPFDGVVGLPQVDPGDRITATTLIASYDNRSSLYLDFEVPESLASEIQHSLNTSNAKKSVLTATTPAFTNKTFDLTMISSASRVNVTSRTLLVRVQLENEKDLLRPGMSFDIDWRLAGAAYASVPEIALQWDSDGSFVWLAREGRAQKVAVAIVARRAGRVLIEGQLQPDEQVVVEGVQRMQPNLEIISSGKAKLKI